MINRGQGPGDSVIYGGGGMGVCVCVWDWGGGQHIWMLAAPEGNLTLKPNQYSSPSPGSPVWLSEQVAVELAVLYSVVAS